MLYAGARVGVCLKVWVYQCGSVENLQRGAKLWFARTLAETKRKRGGRGESKRGGESRSLVSNFHSCACMLPVRIYLFEHRCRRHLPLLPTERAAASRVSPLARWCCAKPHPPDAERDDLAQMWQDKHKCLCACAHTDMDLLHAARCGVGITSF